MSEKVNRSTIAWTLLGGKVGSTFRYSHSLC